MPKRSFNFGQKANALIQEIRVNGDGTATIVFKDKTEKTMPLDWQNVPDFEARTNGEADKKQI